jgi:hypothetical protein
MAVSSLPSTAVSFFAESPSSLACVLVPGSHGAQRKMRFPSAAYLSAVVPAVVSVTLA